MLVKLVSGNVHRTYQCSHNQITYYPDRIQVELMPSGRIMNLPEDGEAIYIMNDRGDTTDSLRWPGRKGDPSV